MKFIKEHKVGVERGRALDPAAGSGALPRWLEPLGCQWHAKELCSEWEGVLLDTPGVELVDLEDSLSSEWPPVHVIANPPFGKLLVRFMSKIHAHCRKHKVFGAVLVPAPWWGESKRAQMWRPDFLVWITGRMQFKLTESTVPTTHVWSVFMPEGRGFTQLVWEPPGEPTADQRAMHKRMMKFDPFQLELF
tara:strand:+ start:2742 stop:3314 length:573 start_codon:yes stop_codon:yes gene_type:complete